MRVFVRVPATGQGYAGGTVPAQSELAGFYAKPTKPKSEGDAAQQRANIPTWSTLTFADGGQPGAPALAAVDGSPATDWQPVSVPASLTAPTSAAGRTIGRVVVTWGRLWPEPPKLEELTATR
jgi:hypothetical protein